LSMARRVREIAQETRYAHPNDPRLIGMGKVVLPEISVTNAAS
jgi:hypothetical protein